MCHGSLCQQFSSEPILISGTNSTSLACLSHYYHEQVSLLSGQGAVHYYSHFQMFLPSSCWSLNSLRCRLQMPPGSTLSSLRHSVHGITESSNRGTRMLHYHLFVLRLCQEDSVHLLPACSLAWHPALRLPSTSSGLTFP